jgi:hypothetical protein
MKTLAPEAVWWCPTDGAEVVSTSRPPCPRDPIHQPVSVGWRVGYCRANYSWYSTAERARTDRRCKK